MERKCLNVKGEREREVPHGSCALDRLFGLLYSIYEILGLLSRG